jgi:PQQ-dependent dehydrogenase (methanol/ethanol family)
VKRFLLAGAVALAALAAGAAGLHGATGVSPNWTSFGRSADENRHSPLTEITKANVGQLRKQWSVDFLQLEPSTKRGQQSYPLAVDGRLFVTTNEGSVWALQATTGKVLWRWQPPNVAVFRNFGIVANRGVAYCDGRLFALQLDMHIAALDPRTGRLLKRVAISDAVPGAAPNYGYSETSAPVCADHVLVVGAAGSEYGVRGFVMGYKPDLTPAWANPYWTIPPAGEGWRSRGRLVGGAVNWTPQAIDTRTGTLYFGTGSGTPLYYPQLRPGPNPRADSLIALDLHTGHQKWWQQQLGRNEWSYDTAQPPLVYDAKVGGKTRRIVSVATMEGVWFAYDAKSGRPLHQRVKVIDRTEHPALRPGQPVVVYPSSLGGVNYSPASFDPTTGYVINAASETAAVDVQAVLTKRQLRDKLVGDVFLGLENGNFGSALQGWTDHGSISAIDVATGRRVWKLRTPEPERGGVTTTATGLGFAGGGDGVLRAFDTKTGKALWTAKTPAPIAAGPTIFAAGGKEYVAITVGGTPTSSEGGTESQLWVFALGRPGKVAPAAQSVPAAAAPARPAAPPPPTASGCAGTFAIQEAAPIRPWTPATDNTVRRTARVLYRGRPVVGARVRVDGWLVPRPTDEHGRFAYPADATAARRHAFAVASLAGATVGGKPLTRAQRAEVLGAQCALSVAYRVVDLAARERPDGTIAVSGRLARTDGSAPPGVSLFTYRLTGRVLDANGKPVAGAVVVTRTQDRNFWTFSQPSNARGAFSSFLTSSDQAGSNPVPLAVQVALGEDSYGLPVGVDASFPRLSSATTTIALPAAVGDPRIAKPSAVAGAIYDGLLVGVSSPRGPIRPVSARWPDAGGRFELVLPRSARGTTVRLWQDRGEFFSRGAAHPGGSVDLRLWPTRLADDVPRLLAKLTLPG